MVSCYSYNGALYAVFNPSLCAAVSSFPEVELNTINCTCLNLKIRERLRIERKNDRQRKEEIRGEGKRE